MANITFQELVEANEVLISPDPITGEKIFSADHRIMNMQMIKFLLSFNDINVVVNASGVVQDTRLIKREVSKIVAYNSPLQRTNFAKPFGSDTLIFTNGTSFETGTLITISFEQPFF